MRVQSNLECVSSRNQVPNTAWRTFFTHGPVDDGFRHRKQEPINGGKRRITVEMRETALILNQVLKKSQVRVLMGPLKS